MNPNTRIPVLAPDDQPLMPTLYRRAQAWVDSGKAEWVSNDLNIKQVRLLKEPASRNTQPIVVGIDPGKKFSGIAVQSSLFTLFTAHLILPFPNIIKKMTGRRILRRARRGRRINRNVAFKLRAHRQKRFDNRRQDKLPPSTRANRETVTPFGFRSGDFVQAQKAGRVYQGWIGGFSQVNNVVSVYDHNWHRIGQFSVGKVMLIKRSTKLCVASVNCPA